MDDLWIEAVKVAPVLLDADSKLGLYLAVDLGFKRIWVVGGEAKQCIYLDHDFAIGGFNDSAGVYLGPVQLLIHPSGFNADGFRGLSKPGSLIIDTGKIFLMGSANHHFGRKVEVGVLTEPSNYPSPINCSKWGLAMLDHEGESRSVFEVDIPSGES